MTTAAHHRVIVLGSGPAGLTAAIYTARANLAPLVIQGPLSGGQLTTTTEVENFPGFEHGIMGPDLMQTMEKQAARFGCLTATDTISKVDLSRRPFSLMSESDRAYTCDALIIATGANARLMGAKGERELMGYGVSTCATCDGAFYRNQIVAVVGGGDSACEEASFLTRFASKVYLVHRRDALRASKIMQERVLKHEKIEVLWNKLLTEVVGTKERGLEKLILTDTVSKAEQAVACNGVFIAIGHTPNSRLFTGQLDLDQNGYILTAPDSSRTKIPGVFACGDVKDHVFRQAITAAGMGCMAALETERWLEAQD